MTIRQTTWLAVVFLLSLSFSQCRSEPGTPPKDEGAKAEELPKEIAANLKQVPNTDLLVSVPTVTVNAPDKTASAPLPLPKACFTTETFTSYATYPVTTCSRDPNFGTVLTQYLAMTGPTNGAVASPESVQVKTFKLSSFAGRSFDPFLVCHLRGGPWNAMIVKQTDCAGITSCTMTLGCTGCPVFLWFGKMCQSTGRPPEVHFFGDLSDGPQFSSPCPGSLSDCGTGDGGGGPGPSPPPHPASL
jgi:hypothetical protein